MMLGPHIFGWRFVTLAKMSRSLNPSARLVAFSTDLMKASGDASVCWVLFVSFANVLTAACTRTCRLIYVWGSLSNLDRPPEIQDNNQGHDQKQEHN